MGAFLSSFQISFLLRGMFAGVSFVVSYYLVTRKDLQPFIDSGKIFTGVLPVALFTGVTIYGLHRSLAYPFLEWFLNSQCAKDLRKGKNRKCKYKWTLVSVNTMKGLVAKCDQKANNTIHLNCERAKYMEAWADYIHFQYTSAWSIIIGYITGAVVSFNSGTDYRGFFWFLFFALFFLITAFASDWRLHSIFEHMSIPPEEPIPSPPKTS